MAPSNSNPSDQFPAGRVAAHPTRILLVDHDELVRDSIARTLARGGHQVAGAGDAAKALSHLAKQRCDLLISELRVPGASATQLAAEARKLRPNLPVILTVSYASVRAAVDAVRAGADAYIAKPFERDELLLLVARTLAQAVAARQLCAYRAASGVGEPSRPLLGGGLQMRRAREQIERFHSTREPVLVRGEAGTGRRHVARMIHTSGARAAAPLLWFNCADENWSEAELLQRLELGEGGTVVLEEVGALSQVLQTLLLRVIQDQAAETKSPSFPDTRLIATTNRDLEDAILDGQMRKDLFARLSAATIELPPLRDRREDIPELVRHFLHRISRREGQPFRHIEAEAVRILQKHAWPGNVRELELSIERAALVERQAGSLRASTLAAWFAEAPALNGHHLPAMGDPLDRLPLAEVEKRVILDTLAKFEGHRAKTAGALGIGIRTLGIKLKKWREEGALEEMPFV